MNGKIRRKLPKLFFIVLLKAINYIIIITMKYLSLYRKYRPMRFEDIVEQDYVVKILRNQVITKNIAHAYLFTGTRGTGKTTIARIFARAINCDNPINGSPCGVCDSCKMLSESNTDIYELDAASNNGVDNIRDIRDSVQYQPLYAKYKVYIIDEVHQLTQAAFNAFLKTLEEPPEYCVFILATTDPQRIPQTILSRCLKLDFRLVSLEGLTDHISNILDKEGFQYTPEAVNLIAEAGEGSVRDALSVLEACISASNGVIDYNSVLEVLGANSPEFIGKTCRAIVSGDLGFALSQVQSATKRGKSISVLLSDILKYFRDLMIIKSTDTANDYLKLPESVYNQAKAIADDFGENELIECLDVFSSIDSKLKTSSNPKFLLETAIAKCSAKSGNSLLQTNSRLDAIERKIENGITITKVVREIEIHNTASGVSVGQSEKGSDMQETGVLPFEIEPPVLPVEKLIQQSTTEEFGERTEQEKVNQKSIARAKSQKLRNALLIKFKNKNLVFVYSVISDKENYIFVRNGYIEIVLNNKLDLDLIKKQQDTVKEVAKEIFGEDFNVSIKFNENKSNEESFLDQFSQNKIIVKK